MRITTTRLGWVIAAALVTPCLVVAAPAGARPSSDFRQAPPQTCSEANVSGGTAAYVPVPGDPAAYQKCGPAGPVGIKHCQTGSAFDTSTGYCVAAQGSGATLGVDAVWQEGDGSDCQMGCPPKPIKVRLTYSGASVGMASVTLFDPASPSNAWGGSASALTGDGSTHSVVITANKLTPTAADWLLKPGATVAVQGYLTDGKANPDGDPTVAVATLNQTVTATTKPAGSNTATA
ncbi:hypothetical protein FZI85_04935 [Mycobacterium sp. CBMA293]|uniref:hypothetical protein n=1 Tax=unclassified Mycolicibacterium TaxID=2636767 RepID=UPI0012DBFE65|nr:MULTISPECIES: hypothetical protein [unclassified Mycolicibacterium]MUL48927.1 hypothetical protein [Mycolicibacterium sp. CBMA 360]MUL58659.1 hypothetical protein [Mycolicibacterium sp. CBMA 335]MUL74117.1 hypothetical protein [Mycolicibacterium sp. CBMA 311]MUL93542.1 hypothetical protein [Mycolicibacterium sp. CBMA 230]MUM10385.1 hypothetical protein [Mycolicibacterium sp. CBMA 293]